MAPDYDALAQEAIRDLVLREHAVVVPREIEAKISEQPHPALPRNRGLYPDLLSRNLQRLIDSGEVEQITHVTKGQGEVHLAVPANRYKQTTRIDRAVRRKSLLYARYRSWRDNLGHAGENAVIETFKAVTQSGYILHNGGRPGVGTLFNKPVQGGPLDVAADFILRDADGIPIGNAVVLVEVKNIREWMYHSSAALYQLLEKSARLQLAFPKLSFVPLFVCRRAHYSIFSMAKQLGFFVAEMKYAPISLVAEITLEHLAEVRNELGFEDIRFGDNSILYIEKLLTRSLPRVAVRTSEQFAETAKLFVEDFRQLRNTSLPPSQRRELITELNIQARDKMGCKPWAYIREDDEEWEDEVGQYP
jgi:hypothetical protein